MEIYRRQVFYYETDKMAIVHNANYLRIFEESRLYFMEQIGVPYPEIEAAGILVPQVEAHVRYHQTMKYGDRFCVSVKLSSYNGARMVYQYEIRLEEGDTLIATGYTSHCFVDEERRMPLSLRKRLPETHEVMLTKVEE